MKIRNLVMGIVSALLVVAAFGGYTPLSYLEATGAQWIYTGYTPKCTDRVETKVRFSSVEGFPFVYCARGANGKNSFSSVLVGSKFRMDHGTSSQTQSANVIVAGVDYSLVANGATGACTLTNATLCTMATAAYEVASPFALLASHSAGSSLSPSTAMSGFVSGRFYYFRVYDQSGNLLRDFIPVRDDDAAADSVQRYGLFETVTGVFHPNCGSKAFTPGPEAGVEPHRMLRTLSVRDVSAQGGGAQVTLDFANPGYAQRLFMAWGSEDGGTTTNGWEHVEALGDVGAWEMSRQVTTPAGASFARFFVQPAIPGAKMLTSLTSTGANQYVDTGFMPDHNSCAECKFNLLAKPSSCACPFGSRNGGNNQFTIFASNSDRWLFRFGTKAIDNATIGKPALLGEHVFRMERNQYIADGIVRYLGMNEFAKQYNIYVFALNNNNAATWFAKMEFYSLMLWDDGVLSRAYVPCVKDDGTPALYDSVTGRFDVNQGATALTCGDEAWSVTAVQAVDFTTPVRAEWTGNGDVANLADPANWTCWNLNDEELANATPTALTEVTVRGVTTFSWPLGRTFSCKTLAFDCTLAADADWRGLDSSRVVSGAQIDLAGHKLQVSELAFDGTITGKADLTEPNAAKVSSSSTFAYSSAWSAFNDNFTWRADEQSRAMVAQGRLPMELVYDFGEGHAKAVNYYRLFGNGQGPKDRMPKSWTLQGANDRQNWTLLDTRAEETGWTVEDNVRTYSFANSTPYRYYRLELTATQRPEADYLSLTQLEFFDGPVPTSELHVDVPEGTVAVNSSVVLKGALKLVKEGAGTLKTTLARQYYTGGNMVVAGTLQAGVNGGNAYGYGEIRVLANGTFDTNGCTDSRDVTLILDGGTLANTAGSVSVNRYTLGKVILKQDSWVNPVGALGAWFQWNESFLDLNGCTLEVLAGDAVQFRGPGTATNGTVKVRSGFITYGAAVEAGTVDFDLFSRLGLYQSLTVHDLTLHEGAFVETAAGTLMVKGTFTPLTVNFPNVQLLDGATLNLGATNGVWSAESATAGLKTSFAENAAVTLDMGRRPFLSGMKVVEWTEGKEPQNVRSVRFNVKNRNCTVQVEDDGIYLCSSGIVIFIR